MTNGMTFLCKIFGQWKIWLIRFPRTMIESVYSTIRILSKVDSWLIEERPLCLTHILQDKKPTMRQDWGALKWLPLFIKLKVWRLKDHWMVSRLYIFKLWNLFAAIAVRKKTFSQYLTEHQHQHQHSCTFTENRQHKSRKPPNNIFSEIFWQNY